MAQSGPTERSVAAGVLGIGVLVIGFVAGAGSLILIGILLTVCLPMLGAYAALVLPIAGPIAGFLGALSRDPWWRIGYAVGLGLVEFGVLDLQSEAPKGVDPLLIGLILVPPTVVGWLVGTMVAGRRARRRASGRGAGADDRVDRRR